MASPTPSSSKRQAGNDLPGPSSKTRRIKPAEPAISCVIGDWVTVKTTGRRPVDQQKAKTPCLVTLVEGANVQVLYPNMLSIFLHQAYGDTVSISFRTEQCTLAEVRPYKKEDEAELDRKMKLLLCNIIANRKVSQPVGTESCGHDGAIQVNPQDDMDVKQSPPESILLDKPKLDEFTVSVSRAFKSACRDVLDKRNLEELLAADFTSEEMNAGFAALEQLNKLMCADGAVFLIA